QQRFVLRLPAEASDRAVVARVIGNAGDAVLRFRVGVGSSIRQNSRVRDIFHQAGAEHWRRNAEDGVALGYRGGEVRLRIHATWSIRSAGDGEEVMNSSIRSAIRLRDEAHFADRTVRENKFRKLVRRAV